MLRRNINRVLNADRVWYVEIDHFDYALNAIEGKPVFCVKEGFLLRSYENHFGVHHIVTSIPSLTTTVVRHVNDKNAFECENEAQHFITQLNNGEVEYVRY